MASVIYRAINIHQGQSGHTGIGPIACALLLSCVWPLFSILFMFLQLCLDLIISSDQTESYMRVTG